MALKTIRDSYKEYKEEVENPVDMDTYLELTQGYNKYIVEEVLYGREISLPARLGSLSIRGREQKVSFDEEGNVKGLAPDWVKTKALWASNPEAKANKKVIYHLNEHTSSHRYRYKWSKKRVHISNKALYSLRMTRENKRAVTKRLREGTNFLNE